MTDAATDPDDLVHFDFECRDGALVEADLTLEEAAKLKRGEPVAMYGGRRVRHRCLDDRIAALKARQDQIEAEQEAMMREYPGIEDGEWDA